MSVATAAANTTAASSMQSPCDFSGKWVLDHSKTEGSVEACMSMLGRTSWEIAMLKRASEVQLLQHYVMQQVHAVQQHVCYCVLGIANFEWESRFALHNRLAQHDNDEKKFGPYSTQSQWVPGSDGRSFAVVWRMTIQGRPTVMTVTRTMSPTDNNACSVHMRVEQQQQVGECRKHYRRESRSAAEKKTMEKMCAGNERHCYKVAAAARS